MNFRGGMGELMRQAEPRAAQGRETPRRAQRRDVRGERRKRPRSPRSQMAFAGAHRGSHRQKALLEEEGLEMVQDLVVAAANAALTKARERVDARDRERSPVAFPVFQGSGDRWRRNDPIASLDLAALEACRASVNERPHDSPFTFSRVTRNTLTGVGRGAEHDPQTKSPAASSCGNYGAESALHDLPRPETGRLDPSVSWRKCPTSSRSKRSAAFAWPLSRAYMVCSHHSTALGPISLPLDALERRIRRRRA